MIKIFENIQDGHPKRISRAHTASLRGNKKSSGKHAISPMIFYQVILNEDTAMEGSL
jgi:hypothetical protein